MPAKTLSPLAELLQERATTIADHLLAKKLVTQAEIDACFDKVLDDDPEYKIANAFAGLRVLLSERSPSKEGKAAKLEKADRVILDALRGAPLSVTLTEPIGDVKKVSVYPKSLNTLIELAQRDEVITYYNVGVDAIHTLNREQPSAERAEHLARAMRELVYQQQICLWIVTHTGPGQPYPEEETTPQPPEWLGQLSPIDALMIFAAHEQVNSGRLAALQALPRGKRMNGDGEKRGWGVYLANLGSLLNQSAEELSRDYSLATLFAQSYVHAVDQERAMESAKEG